VEMGLSNRFRDVKAFDGGSTPAGCMVVFAVDSGRRMIELRGRSLQCG
jgi:hypothetical protein